MYLNSMPLEQIPMMDNFYELLELIMANVQYFNAALPFINRFFNDPSINRINPKTAIILIGKVASFEQKKGISNEETKINQDNKIKYFISQMVAPEILMSSYVQNAITILLREGRYEVIVPTMEFFKQTYAFNAIKTVQSLKIKKFVEPQKFYNTNKSQ